MFKQELVAKISKYFRINEFEAEKILNDIFSSIISGVQKDRVTEIANFGEFILKINGAQKSVEFLPSTNLEEELAKLDLSTKPLTEIEKTYRLEVEIPQSKPEHSLQMTSIEEEIKRKREIILEKLKKQTEEANLTPLKTTIPPAEKIVDTLQEVSQSSDEETVETLQEVSQLSEEEIEYKEALEKPAIEYKIEAKGDEAKELPVLEEIPQEPVIEKIGSEIEEVDEASKKTFSDYFSEIKDDSIKTYVSQTGELSEIKEPPTVIPQSAVEIHNEIVNIEPKLEKTTSYDTQELKIEEPQVSGENGKPYYIWYKESEPVETETQVLAAEYELLYQAQKETEYKPKLKIYVSTFITFFTFVLILLIFSPVIYKIFFTPVDFQIITETIPENQTTLTPEENIPSPTTQTQETGTQQQAGITTPTEQQPTEQTNVQTPVQQPTEQTGVQPSTQEPEQKVEPTTEFKTDGLVKTSMGWTDEKLKVIYIILDNNKITIQESAWDSETKAAKRIKSIDDLKIDGLAGTVIRADLGEKGIWFRVRLGEFNTMEEARNKAQELRNKEKLRLHAFISFLLLITKV